MNNRGASSRQQRGALGCKRTGLEQWLEDDLLRRFGDRILPVTVFTADRWGAIAAHRQSIGRPMTVEDGLIAARALEHNLTLVTGNVEDFAGLGLDLLNPWNLPP